MFFFLTGFPDAIILRPVYVKGPDLHMVFELCSEGDLMDYLLKKDRFEEPLAASCAQAIVAAVGFCHSQNIAHRDIKVERCSHPARMACTFSHMPDKLSSCRVRTFLSTTRMTRESLSSSSLISAPPRTSRSGTRSTHNASDLRAMLPQRCEVCATRLTCLEVLL